MFPKSFRKYQSPSISARFQPRDYGHFQYCQKCPAIIQRNRLTITQIVLWQGRGYERTQPCTFEKGYCTKLKALSNYLGLFRNIYLIDIKGQSITVQNMCATFFVKDNFNAQVLLTVVHFRISSQSVSIDRYKSKIQKNPGNLLTNAQTLNVVYIA